MADITIHLPEERTKVLLAEAERRGVNAESLLLAWIDERLGALVSRGARTSNSDRPWDTLSRALGMARTDRPPPDDKEVKRWLEERRIERFGEGLGLSPESNGRSNT